MGLFRLFLALSVVIGHARQNFFTLPFLDREVAVESFFMISGFYMALVLTEKYTFAGRYWTFIQQRFLRLYPTYLIILLLILLVDGSVYLCTGSFWGSLKNWADYAHLAAPATLAFMVMENIVIFGQEFVMLLHLDQATGYLDFSWGPHDVKPIGATEFLLNGPGWSLSVEFCFYLVAPFLVTYSARTQIGIVALCFALRYSMWLLIPWDSYHWIYCLFPANLFFFMAGSLSYHLYKNYGTELKDFALKNKWILGIFIFIGLAYRRLPHAHEIYVIWFPIVFVMVPLLFALTSKNRTDRLIGELSFPCYLLHEHVLMVTRPLFLHDGYKWLVAPSSVFLSVGLAYLFYRFIETHTERFREGVYRKSRQRGLAHNPAPASSSLSGEPTAS